MIPFIFCIFSTIICRPRIKGRPLQYDGETIFKKKNEEKNEEFFFKKQLKYVSATGYVQKVCARGGDSMNKRIYSRATGKSMTVSRCDAVGGAKNKIKGVKKE